MVAVKTALVTLLQMDLVNQTTVLSLQYLRLNVLKSYAALHQHYMALTPSVV
jgi:hypothetical protein